MIIEISIVLVHNIIQDYSLNMSLFLFNLRNIKVFMIQLNVDLKCFFLAICIFYVCYIIDFYFIFQNFVLFIKSGEACFFFLSNHSYFPYMLLKYLILYLFYFDIKYHLIISMYVFFFRKFSVLFDYRLYFPYMSLSYHFSIFCFFFLLCGGLVYILFSICNSLKKVGFPLFVPYI